MRRYTAGPRYDSRPRGEAGITAQYLEAMDDDDLGGDSDDADGLTATERARTALRRNADVRSILSSGISLSLCWIQIAFDLSAAAISNATLICSTSCLSHFICFLV